MSCFASADFNTKALLGLGLFTSSSRRPHRRGSVGLKIVSSNTKCWILNGFSWEMVLYLTGCLFFLLLVCLCFLFVCFFWFPPATEFLPMHLCCFPFCENCNSADFQEMWILRKRERTRSRRWQQDYK